MIRAGVLGAALVLALSGSAEARAEKVTVLYSVKKGDTLSGISQRFDVPITDIVGWNESLKEQMLEKAAQLDPESLQKASFKLVPGMTIKVPGKPTGNKKVISYTVQKGDSLWAIGKKFHVKPAVIVKWNSEDLAVDDDEEPEAQKPSAPDLDAAAANLKVGMLLSVPGKPSGSEAKTIKHKVKKGESLWTIGKKYNVKPAVLVKWNPDKLGGDPKPKKSKSKKGKQAAQDDDDLPVLQPGMKLVIHAERPDLGPRIAVLRVQKGNTPKQVAKTYSVDLKDLLAHNFLLAKDTLSVGDIVEVPLPITTKDTRSTGSPNGGKLVSGELMPDGPGYLIRKPALAYGTSETITGIVRCVAHVQRSFKNTHDLVIGHLSKKGGGKLFPHKSHQSGRDVDLGYYHGGAAPMKFIVATPENLDVDRTAELVQCFADSGQVQYMFVNTYIQKMLYDHFKKKKKATAEFLTTVFQYPHEEGKQLGIIRHEKGHDDHIHVRFFCPEGDEGCHD